MPSLLEMFVMWILQVPQQHRVPQSHPPWGADRAAMLLPSHIPAFPGLH